MTRRWPWLVPLLLLAFPAPAAAVDWATPASPISGNVGEFTTPVVASNARGDTAVAWLDIFTNHIFVSDRPAGGSFSMATEVSTLADQRLGSVELDAAGNVYVFFITEVTSNANSQPNVAVRPVGGTNWDITKLAPKNSADPAFDPIAGAVAPDGRAVAVWFQGHTANASLSKLVFSTKPAGSSTWAGKLDLPGGTGNSPSQPDLAINSSGQAALVIQRQGCGGARVHGATMTAAGTWTSLNPLQVCPANSAPLAGGPFVGIDENGTATAVWERNDGPAMGSGNDIVQFSTKAIGVSPWPTAAASGATVDLSATGANASFPSVAVAPDGTTTVTWVRSGALEERTRPAGGSFAGVNTIPNSLTSPLFSQLATAADGSTVAIWAGMNSTPKLAIGAARRAPGAATFSALPTAPGGDNNRPALAIDGEGNTPAAWIHTNTPGPTYVVQATGLDAAGPAISDVLFPSAAALAAPFPYGATLTDRWSAATAGIWGFGDGTTGPLTGTKIYATAGTFDATLSASDSHGNTSQATRSIVVDGGPGAGGGGGTPDTVRPEFLSARLTNVTFAVDPAGRAETPVAAARPKGTTFVYSLSETARVVFTIHSKRKGRRVGRRCVKPTPRNRGRRACTRFVRVGRFAQDGAAGRNRKRFSGKIGARTLRRGNYRATLIATDAAGNRSRKRLLNFAIVRR